MTKYSAVSVQQWGNGNHTFSEYTGVVKDYAVRKHQSSLSDTLPVMVEFGRIQFPATGEYHDYQLFIIPENQVDSFFALYSTWIENDSPVPFVTYLYTSLIDGAIQLVSAIDPDGLLTQGFMEWLNSDDEVEN